MTPPLFFVDNRGQTPGRAAYLLHGSDKSFAFGKAGVTIELHRPKGGAAPRMRDDLHRLPEPVEYEAARLSLDFVGANPDVEIIGESKLKGVVNYHVGDPAGHHAGVPTYASIRYRNLWPGIDLVYSGEPQRLKYELRVAPGADPRVIRFRYRGADPSVTAGGQLSMKTAAGDFTDERPVSFQGSRRVATAWQTWGDGEAGFEVGEYDRGRELVIDPAILVRSYVFGVTGTHQGNRLATDASGNVYVGGVADSAFTGLTATNSPTGLMDGFVAKFDSAGVLNYVTLVGGAYDETLNGIAADSQGFAYVTGATRSSNFPIVSGFGSLSGGSNAYLTKLSPSGAIVSSSQFGSSSTDEGVSVAVDNLGNAYVVGSTDGAFPVTQGSTSNGKTDVFLAIVATSGTASISNAIVFGGSEPDSPSSVTLDNGGNIYVGGFTRSLNFPATLGAFSGGSASSSGFVAKFAASPFGTPVFATVLTGSPGNYTVVHAAAPDSAGNVFVAGHAEYDLGLPVNPGFSFASGNRSGMLIKLDPAGTPLWADYLSTTAFSDAYNLALDAQGRPHLTGEFAAQVFRSIASQAGQTDGFFLRLSTDGKTVECAQGLGGSAIDWGGGIGVTPAGNVWVAGTTTSAAFPLVAASPGLDAQSVARNVFLAEISCTLDCVGVPSGLSAWWQLESGPGSTLEVVTNTSSTVVFTGAGAPSFPPGVVGHSLLFNANTYVQHTGTNADFGTGDFSIDFWLRLTSSPEPGNFRTILEKRAGNNGYRVYTNGLSLGLELSDGSSTGSYTVNIPPLIGSWHFIAVTVRRNSPVGVRFYLDGVAIGTPGNPAAQAGTLSNTGPFRLGARSAAAAPDFIGGLDEVELFQRELTVQEVLALFNARSAGKCVTVNCPDLTSQVRATLSGTQLTVNTTLINKGGAPVSSFQYEVFLASDAACTANVQSLGTYSYSATLQPGQSAPVTNVISLATTPGSYFVCTRTDPFNRVKECVETDPLPSSPIVVSPACSNPDFAVTSVIVSPSSLSAGSAGTVAVTVVNNGGAYIGTNVVIKIYTAPSPTSTNRVLVGTLTLPGMTAGGTVILQLAFIAPAVGFTTGASQAVYFIAEVDAGNVVSECDETNNTGSQGPIVIRPGPISGGHWTDPIFQPVFDPSLPPYEKGPGDSNFCNILAVQIPRSADVDVYVALGRPVGRKIKLRDDLDGKPGVTGEITPDMIDHDYRATGPDSLKKIRFAFPADLPAERRQVYVAYVVKSASEPGEVTFDFSSCNATDPACANTPTDQSAQYKFDTVTDPIKDSAGNADGAIATPDDPFLKSTYTLGGKIDPATRGSDPAAYFSKANGAAIKLGQNTLFDSVKGKDLTFFAYVKLDPNDPINFVNTIFSFSGASKSDPSKTDVGYYFYLRNDSGGPFPNLAVKHPTGFLRERTNSVNLPVPRDNAWHCVGLRISNDGATLQYTFFVDGKTGSDQITETPMTLDPNGDAWIGFEPGPTNASQGRNFLGYMDEFQVFSRALSDDEMKALCGTCAQAPIQVTLDTNPAFSNIAPLVIDDQTPPASTTNGTGTATAPVTPGDSVLLSAPNSWNDNGTYYLLTGYSPGGPNVTPTASAKYTANYKTLCYVVAVTWTPPNGGTVAIAPPNGGYTSYGAPANCYEPGAVLTIISTPASGFTTGTPTATGSVTIVNGRPTVNGPGTITVPFTSSSSTGNVTVNTNPANIGATVGLTGSGTAANTYSTSTFTAGAGTVTVTPTSITNTAGDTRYDFANWSQGGTPNAAWTNASQGVTIPSGGATYTANFDTLYKLTVTVTGNCSATTPTGFYRAAPTLSVGVIPPAPSPGDPLDVAGIFFKSMVFTPSSGPNAGVAQTFTSYASLPASVPWNAPGTLVITCRTPVQIPLEVNTNPANIDATVGFGNSTALNVFTSSQFTDSNLFGLTASQTATKNGTVYQFQNWTVTNAQVTNVNQAATSAVLPTSGNSVFTANYLASQYLVTATGCGVTLNNGTVAPAQGLALAINSTVTVNPNPATGQSIQSVIVVINGVSTTLSGPPYSFALSGPAAVTVNCGAGNPVTHSVNTNPPGLLVAIDGGAPATGPRPATWTPGTAHTLAATTPGIVNGTAYSLTNWSPNGPTAANWSIASSPTTATNYVANYTLSGYVVNATGCGVTVGPASQAILTSPLVFPAGQSLTLTANPPTGQQFQSFQITIGANTTNVTTNPATITLSAPATITANCGSPTNVTLTVTSNPVGLHLRIGASGGFGTGPIVRQVPANSTQTIAAESPQVVDGIGYRFTGWSTGATTPVATVQPAGDLTAVANFQTACYLVNVTGTANGTVALNPASGGITGFPDNCFAPGAQVRILATANTGYGLRDVVINIGGATTTVTTPNTPITVSGPTVAQATFIPRPATVSTIFPPVLVNGTTYRDNVFFSNPTPTPGNSLQITGVTFNTTAGTGTVTLQSSLPIVFGALPANGQSSTQQILFNIPATVTGYNIFVTVEVKNANGDTFTNVVSVGQTK
ncbi:MAG: LamG-like jellyroll fold domain-containing protein [Bryobacteraceae bacterium]